MTQYDHNRTKENDDAEDQPGIEASDDQEELEEDEDQDEDEDGDADESDVDETNVVDLADAKASGAHFAFESYTFTDEVGYIKEGIVFLAAPGRGFVMSVESAEQLGLALIQAAGTKRLEEQGRLLEVDGPGT